MATKKRTRMYEPWGYREENNYQGDVIIMENDLDSFFSGVQYNRDDNKIHFTNKDGEEVGTLNVNDFVKSDSIIEKVEYNDGILKITFTNGDVISIDLTELLDENEFKDGLIVDGHQVKVLIDGESERWLTVSENGVKVSGIQAEIDRLDERIDDETSRATSEEERIEERLDEEIQNRIDDVNEEETRAKGVEQILNTKIDQEIADRIADVDTEESRAIAEETTIKDTIGNGFSTVSTETITAKFSKLTNDLDTEVDNRTTQDNQLQNNINTESTARQGADTRLENLITDERNRAISTESSLNNKIDKEITDRAVDVDEEEARAISAETEINNTAVFGADYIESSKTIAFYNKNNQLVDTIDATPFVKDGMIERVYIDHETNELVIVWNTESGEEETRIALSEIFNPDDYYTKDEVNAFLDEKVDKRLDGTNGTALIFNESDGGGAKFEHSDGTWSFVGVNDGGESGIAGQIYALKKNVSNKFEGARIDVTKDGMYYTVGDDSSAIRDVAENEIAVKGDIKAVDDKINDVINGDIPIVKLENLIEKLGYQDNDTLKTTDEHEVAFGEYNISHYDDINPSGQTIFSVGIGTSEENRKNAIEVMKDGSVFMWIEGEFMNINKLLGQISHEVYDTNSTSGGTQNNS